MMTYQEIQIERLEDLIDALEAIVADKGNVYAIARKALAAAKEIEGRV